MCCSLISLMLSIRSSDNGKIASGGVDRSVMLFDVASGEVMRKYTAHWEVLTVVKHANLSILTDRLRDRE